MDKNRIKLVAVVAVVVVCGMIWLWNDRAQGQQAQRDTDMFASLDAGASAAPAEDGKEAEIYVHITGAVKKPGVYTFAARPRLVEVVERAGGFTKDAIKNSVNQAETVEDGTQIIIESTRDKKEKKTTGNQDDSGGRVNINEAGKDELMTLTGIGESKAASIISYREQHGAFRKIEDIMNITGIKDGVFAKIKDQIRV